MASYKRQEQCKIIKYTVLKMFLLTGEVKCFLYLCTIYRHVRKHNKKRINFCEMSSRSFWSFKIKSGREKTGQNVFKTWACATTLTFSTKICHIRYEDIRAWSLTNGGGGTANESNLDISTFDYYGRGAFLLLLPFLVLWAQ